MDGTLLEQARFAFESPAGSSAPGRTYAPDFGARRMARDLEILEMPERALVGAWERCVRDAIKAKVALEDEVSKAMRENFGVLFSFVLFLYISPDLHSFALTFALAPPLSIHSHLTCFLFHLTFSHSISHIFLPLQTEHIKRTHDYEPFVKEFVTCLQSEGLLEALLDVNGQGKSKASNAKRVKLNGKG